MHKGVNAIALLLVVGSILFFPMAARPDTATGSLSGVVTDTNGAVIVGATLLLSGQASATTVTDKGGTFQFSALPFGKYSISVTKAGYSTTSRNDVIVGPNTTVSVVLVAANIHQLGRIVVRGQASSINVTPASVYEVTSQTFQDQGQVQLRRVLEEIPGVMVGVRDFYVYNNFGISSLGNDTLIRIRGAFSYETSTLIDGHPFAGGGVTPAGFNAGMLNTVGLQRIDTIKGPGASAPTINGAIGGSVNYLTIEPSGVPKGNLEISSDGYGGSVLAVNTSGSFTNGKLGYAFGHQAQNTPGGLTGRKVAFIDAGLVNGQQIATCFTGPPCAYYIYTPNWNITLSGSPFQQFGYSLLLCCAQLSTQAGQYSDFGKLIYHLSPSTSVSAVYMASTTVNNFGGYEGTGLWGPFTPPAGYTGSIPAGFQAATIFYPNETTGSSMYQGFRELNLLTHVLHGSLRLSYATMKQDLIVFGQGTAGQGSQFLAYGAIINPSTSAVTIANGTPVTVSQFQDDYMASEFYKIGGLTAQYDLPLGGNLYSIGFDKTTSAADGGNRCCGPAFPYDNFAGLYYGQQKQVVTSVLLRAQLYPWRNINVIASGYFNRYDTHLADKPLNFGCCNPTGGTEAFGVPDPVYLNSYKWHSRFYDAPRVALTFHPSGDVSWRFAAGGAIAPIPMTNLNSAGSPPALGNPPTQYTQTLPSTGLGPETAFGYNAGVDVRYPSRSLLVSYDAYFTNLFGLYLTQTVFNGFFNGSGPCTGGPNCLPLYVNTFSNLANARYEGVEFAVKRDRGLGFNWQVNGALMRAFAYNVSPALYANPSTGQKYATNLTIVPNINFNDGANGGPGSGSEASPYSEGYAEVSYRTRHDGLLLFGATYYGPNNTYYRPAFFVLTASARHEIAPNTSVQATVDNIGNLYPGLVESFYDSRNFGVPVVLASHQLGMAPGGNIGPRLWKFSLIRSF